MAIHRIRASQPYVPVVLFANARMADGIALIDTGASVTAIHPRLIETLDPIQIGAFEVSRVGQPARWEPTYFITVRLGPEATGFGVEAVKAVPASPCDLLIGRDLLSRWILSWDGQGDHLLIGY